MLLNDLYTIEGIQASEDALCAGIRLNAAHPIFAGHFPGHPILPGACQIQLVRELLSHLRGKEYRLSQAGQIKFLAMIDPREHATLELILRFGPGDHVIATLCAGGTVFLKFNGNFVAE